MESLSMQTADPMMQKKMEILLEMNNKKIAAEISTLKQSINSLTEEVSSLKRQLSELRFSQPKPDAKPVVAEKPVEPQPAVQKAAEPSRGAETVSMQMARTGNYKSGDVGIDKFFYFGNKR